MEYHGIDVSRWQGAIDWKKVKEAGVSFAMIKALQGKKPDPRFLENLAGATENGVFAGLYVYSKAKTAADAAAEAEKAMELAKGFTLRFPAAIDFEDECFLDMDESGRGAIIEAFCERIKELGALPIVYSNRDWFTRVIPKDIPKKYDIWLASWRSSKPKGDFAMWQSGAGTVDGIGGEVDLDVCFKDYPALTKPPVIFKLTRPRQRGRAFLLMQEALIEAGYRDAENEPLTPDGVWGKRSEEAFKKLLSENG